MDELVSVIVPVYNVEKYLEECVSSILNQTYRNFEIILVDDGSVDQSSSICDKLANIHKNIRVIHKANGGLSDARNTGVIIAKGNYLSFVDSDDVIWDRYLEVLMEAMRENDADIVQGSYIEARSLLGEAPGEMQVFVGKEAFKEYLLFGKISVSACAKLYKRCLFDNVSFPLGRINEDNLTMYKLFYFSSKVVTVPYNIYYYRVNEGTIMHGAYNIRRFEVTSVGEEINEFLGKEKDNYKAEVDFHSIRILYWVYNEALIHSKKNEYREEKGDLRRKIICFGTDNPYLSWRYKTYYYLLKYVPYVYRNILLIYRRKEIGR